MFRKIALQLKKPAGFLGVIITNLMMKKNRPEYETVINDLKIQPEDKLLEIGYGPGVGINMISKMFVQCYIYGIDFSELMFKRASKRNKQFIENNKVRLQFGDFNNSEISTYDFDKIFCLNVVYFWDDLQIPFEKVLSLLKKGGMFCFYMAKNDDLARLKFTKNDIFNKYSIEQITHVLQIVGFKDISYYYRRGYYIRAKK
jgi:SAM-dependent methyltransferase